MDDKVKYIDGEIYIHEDIFCDQRLKNILAIPDGLDLATMYFELYPHLEDGISFDEALASLMPRFHDIGKIINGILWLEHYDLLTFEEERGYNCYIYRKPEK